LSLHGIFVAPFEYEFMRRALWSACWLSVSGGLLGSILVLRRMALMGDALSHSLLPGIALAWLLFGPSPAALFAGALIAGLLTALGSALLSRLTRIKEDAAFGSLFLVFFGAGVALLSRVPTRLNLEHFLFGSVLGVTRADLQLTALITGVTLLAFSCFYRSLLLECFDPSFYRASGGRGAWVHLGLLGFTVLNLVSALQTMGVVLALGLFLLPGATAYLWCDHFSRLLALAVGIAAACSAAGILISYHAGIASGAAIVLSLGAVFLVSAVFSPGHGAARRLLEYWRERRSVKVTPQ
jgi:zinc/manganese transport system permease protein